MTSFNPSLPPSLKKEKKESFQSHCGFCIISRKAGQARERKISEAGNNPRAPRASSATPSPPATTPASSKCAAAAAGNKVARERGQREAQSCGAGRPSLVPFCHQAEPLPRGRGPCASDVAQITQARPQLTACPRPGPAWPS